MLYWLTNIIWGYCFISPYLSSYLWCWKYTPRLFPINFLYGVIFCTSVGTCWESELLDSDGGLVAANFWLIVWSQSGSLSSWTKLTSEEVSSIYSSSACRLVDAFEPFPKKDGKTILVQNDRVYLSLYTTLQKNLKTFQIEKIAYLEYLHFLSFGPWW